jgi:hypothetical protein
MHFCQTTRHHMPGDSTPQFLVYLTLQVPRTEIVDLYKNLYIRQHVTSVDILYELRSQETFLDFSLHLEFVRRVYERFYNLPMKEE